MLSLVCLKMMFTFSWLWIRCIGASPVRVVTKTHVHVLLDMLLIGSYIRIQGICHIMLHLHACAYVHNGTGALDGDICIANVI